ncbi:DUF1385 domain-containing protein [Candidatus Aerophobetes bacterium]|uniref:DUF1385 domain-containing protein n=1 Tax=Aerophobetes bacterium TaxID=2030807 RepID=A0A662D5L4_UNCAE|nr:MAG: DUF1385 domain-containing protein [Candidatus Aerophobetes bacterium]
MLRKEFDVGGQAVIEGVMMRSPKFITIAIRKSSGEIMVKKEPYISLTKRFKFLNIPIIRGVVVLIETLYIGVKALTFSANEAIEDEESKATKESEAEEDKKGEIFTSIWLFLMVILGIGLGFLLFFYLPLWLTDLLGVKTGFLFNLVDGIIRIAIFLIYIWLITLWKDMRRIFEYHGAEHKSIHTLEAGEELIPENMKKYPTLHARCGTSFLLIVMVVSIIIFMALGRPKTLADRLVRFSFIPLIAGISYEFIKLSGKVKNNKLAKILIAPGLWLQKMTTKEPDEKQMEVAIAALKNALD